MSGKPRIKIANLAELAEQYMQGASVPQLCEGTEFSHFTLRRRFLAMGIMRGKREGVQMAFATGRMANRKTRAGIPQSEESKIKQSKSMIRRWAADAKGTGLTSQGYLRFTRTSQPNYGRLVHVVAMEEAIGRALLPNECVHHIDHDKLNNNMSNLQLMTFEEHARLHRAHSLLWRRCRR